MAAAILWTGPFGTSAPASPAQTPIHFTPPLATAKTIQVTERVFENRSASVSGPLHQTGTLSIWIERPDKFRAEWKDSRHSRLSIFYVSDGKTLVGYDGKHLSRQATAAAEWPFPIAGLLNNMPGPVSAIPVVRNGRPVLLAVRANPDRSEYWFDPKTHLLIRDRAFLTWKGKTAEILRTDYSGWKLNKPLSSALFHWKVPAGVNAHIKLNVTQ